MVVWTGFGWLGFLIPFGVHFATIPILELILGPGFYARRPFVVGVCSWVLGSLLCYPIGRYFNRALPVRFIDSDLAEHGRTQAHTTFYIRLEFAGVVMGFMPIVHRFFTADP
jgi:membrane protein YqaA with SNARE-associated domain